MAPKFMKSIKVAEKRALEETQNAGAHGEAAGAPAKKKQKRVLAVAMKKAKVGCC